MRERAADHARGLDADTDYQWFVFLVRADIDEVTFWSLGAMSRSSRGHRSTEVAWRRDRA